MVGSLYGFQLHTSISQTPTLVDENGEEIKSLHEEKRRLHKAQ